MVFLIITFATLLNMLIGVICEVISDAAAEEEERDLEDKLRKSIEEAFSEIDVDANGIVSQKEWSEVKKNENVRATMIDIGLEEERLEERLDQMQSMLFSNK